MDLLDARVTIISNDQTSRVNNTNTLTIPKDFGDDYLIDLTHEF